MRRRVISIKTIVDAEGEERLLALCDDSTIWVHNPTGDDRWYRLPDIPEEPDDEANSPASQ